jgi:heme A synthase
VIAESAGFALLAAISPTALLVMVIFLGSDNPRRIAMLYVAGAILMTVAMAITVLIVLHATGLNQPRQHEPRYGLRLGLGILALALAVFMTQRARARQSGQASSPGSPRARGR